MYRTDEFVHLAIRRISKGNWVQLMSLKSTADYYGWTEVFPDLFEAKSVDYPGNIRPWPTKLNGKNYKGCRLRICRDKTYGSGNPAGLTNCFRVSNNASKLDLYAVAQAVKVDFAWMNDKTGARIKRSHWRSVDLPDEYCHCDLRAAD